MFKINNMAAVYYLPQHKLFTVSYTNIDNVLHLLPLIHQHQLVQLIDYRVDYLDLVVLVNDTGANNCI